MDLVAGVREHLWVPFRVSFPRGQVLPFKVVVTGKNIFTPDEKCVPGLLSPTKKFTPDENIYKNSNKNIKTPDEKYVPGDSKSSKF